MSWCSLRGIRLRQVVRAPRESFARGRSVALIICHDVVRPQTRRRIYDGPQHEYPPNLSTSGYASRAPADWSSRGADSCARGVGCGERSVYFRPTNFKGVRLAGALPLAAPNRLRGVCFAIAAAQILQTSAASGLAVGLNAACGMYVGRAENR